MPFQRGHSYGNRGGRPPKFRALADSLRRVLAQNSADGISNMDALSQDINDILLTRQTINENGEMVTLSHREWFELYKWVCNHLDGPMPTEIDVQPIERLPADGAIPADRLERVFTAQVFLIKKYLSGDTLNEFMTEWRQLAAQTEMLPNHRNGDDGGTDE